MRSIRSSWTISIRLCRRSASRGISPAEHETYSSGVRKAIYRDAEGNEIGFGGAPG